MARIPNKVTNELHKTSVEAVYTTSHKVVIIQNMNFIIKFPIAVKVFNTLCELRTTAMSYAQLTLYPQPQCYAEVRFFDIDKIRNEILACVTMTSDHRIGSSKWSFLYVQISDSYAAGNTMEWNEMNDDEAWSIHFITTNKISMKS